MMSVTDEIIERLSDVNIVSFSGGKDSTVVLQHVVSAIGDSGKKLFIVTADTLMEIPYFNQYLNRTNVASNSNQLLNQLINGVIKKF